MSDGGIGDGVSFWATFTISGGVDGLKKEELQGVMNQIKAILGGNTAVTGRPVRGRIVTAGRLSDNVGDGTKPTLNVVYGPNKKPQ